MAVQKGHTLLTLVNVVRVNYGTENDIVEIPFRASNEQCLSCFLLKLP